MTGSNDSNWWAALPAWQKNTIQVLAAIAVLAFLAFLRQDRPSSAASAIESCFDELMSQNPAATQSQEQVFRRTCQLMCRDGDLSGCP